MKKRTCPPSLKSASGGGFFFEDKVSALLLCEMLIGKQSLGKNWGIIQKLERQAADWEPFGDVVLTLPNSTGKLVKCGCSVKSNQPVNTNGCKPDLQSGLWATMARQNFVRNEDGLALFCAPLAQMPHKHLNDLCRQARENDPFRLEQKIAHKNHQDSRKIYNSFQNPSDKSDSGLPGHSLAHLVPREFDFENSVSQDEIEALRLCRELLSPESLTNEAPANIWHMLFLIAGELRVSGGIVTREKLAARLRPLFSLRGDPCDVSAWTRIRDFSKEWLTEIEISLPGGISLPRTHEFEILCKDLEKNRAIHILGESGSGKSALVKKLATQNLASGSEVVWIKAEMFNLVKNAVPNFIEVLLRIRCNRAILIFDATESCYESSTLSAIAQSVKFLTQDLSSPWLVILICQTPDWPRVSQVLVKNLPDNSALNKKLECGELSKEDFALVCASSISVAMLSNKPHLRRILKSPKMLDVLLSGQVAENRVGTEADLIEWWWEQQVRGTSAIAAEENVARRLASQMADELCTELPPTVVAGDESAANNLIKNRVLSRTRDGRIRFSHDLLADWSRVMYLRSLGESALGFMRAHAENPPWIRAVRLLSQHFLERMTDMECWRNIVAACNSKTKNKEPSAENCQVLDPWLEAIVHCADVKQMLHNLKGDLFANTGYLFRRFIRRLLFVGTIPDAVIQQRFREIDCSVVETAGIRYRLPLQSYWAPVIDFIVENKNEATNYLPVELAEIASMWSRLEQYLQTQWPALADVILLNGEKELRREVAGEHRWDHGVYSFGDASKSRVNIYVAALQAASQHPDRAAALVLKAAGRIPWDEGDVSENSDEGWRGEWHERSQFGRWNIYIKQPPESWPEGPKRNISDDFFHAWFEYNAAIALFKNRPNTACEATLAFLIDWPKSEIRPGQDHYGHEVDHYGFTFNADHMYPPFWNKANFLTFLRENWQAAVDMIVRLVNFATDRYENLYKIEEIIISTPHKVVSWKGNYQIYLWSRHESNTAQVVTCALMALEKWMDEQLDVGKPILNTVQLLYEKSRSLAFAGLLINLGKRHPILFCNDLKPLLFILDFYFYDLRAVRESWGNGYWPADSKTINKLRQDWNQLPGRRKHLKDFCCTWLFEDPKLQGILNEVSQSWQKEAEKLPAKSKGRLTMLRMAADFDKSLWKEVVLRDGKIGWTCQRPVELEDVKGEDRIQKIQHLITLPFECSDWLDQRQEFSDAQLNGIWQQLQEWEQFEQLGIMEGEKPDAVQLRDHRHARAGLLAILLCTGELWLKKHSGRQEWLEKEVLKILANPPEVISFGPDEIHDDYESLLARASVSCWARCPQDPKWRQRVANFATAYRYRTILRTFQESFRVRRKLGKAYQDLEGLALSFASIRQKATQVQLMGTRIDKAEIQNWRKVWLPRFALGRGPKWTKDWASVETLEPFPHDKRPRDTRSKMQKEVYRRDYGLDMGVILAAFGRFPDLIEAANSEERAHWLDTCAKMVNLFCQTLPSADKTTDIDAKWHYNHWSSDEEIFKIVARRLFECTISECRKLWEPIIKLPFSAHHHICSFLNQLIIASLQTEPVRITELVPIWHEIADQIFAAPVQSKRNWHNQLEVHQHVLLYGSAASVNEDFWGPLVEDLRPRFKDYLDMISSDAHEQSRFVRFLTTKAGERLLIDAMTWLQPWWEQTNDSFWDTVVEEGQFSEFLEYSWRQHFEAVRATPIALKAFKLIILKLASHHIPIALEIQQQI